MLAPTDNKRLCPNHVLQQCMGRLSNAWAWQFVGWVRRTTTGYLSMLYQLRRNPPAGPGRNRLVGYVAHRSRSCFANPVPRH